LNLISVYGYNWHPDDDFTHSPITKFKITTEDDPWSEMRG